MDKTGQSELPAHVKWEDTPERADETPSSNSAKKVKTDPSASSHEPQWDLDALLIRKLDERSTRWSRISGSKNLDFDYWRRMKDPRHAYEFTCVCGPCHQKEGLDDNIFSYDESHDRDSRYGAPQALNTGIACVCNKTTSLLPSHRYILSRAGKARYDTAVAMLALRNPSTFHLSNTFSEHLTYGALEVMQNLIRDFDEELRARQWREVWAIIEGLVLFMLFTLSAVFDETVNRFIADDIAGTIETGVHETVTLIARMMLTIMAMLEAQGQLNMRSDIKNIGWIIFLFRRVVQRFRGRHHLLTSFSLSMNRFDVSENHLDLYLQHYASRCGIVLSDVETLEISDFVMPDTSSKDPWGWNKALTDYKNKCMIPPFAYRGRSSEIMTNDYWDISTWTSAERTRASVENSDPISGTALVMLEKGQVLCL